MSTQSDKQGLNKIKLQFGIVAIIAIAIIWLGLTRDTAKPSKWPYTQEEESKRREEIISNCFSAWDGSNIELTKFIKESMNDPDSYEHIQTTYQDINNEIIIHTTFRGKNAFGGVVKQSISATISLNCNIIEIHKL